MSPVDPLVVAKLVTDAIEAAGARYSIGGSMASAFAGEPRSTLDVDIVADLAQPQIDAFFAAVKDAFYVDMNALRRAVDSYGSVNLIHIESSVKIDLFVAGGTMLDDSLLQRRREVTTGEPPVKLYVHSPEDILLQKLRWFRLGGEVSDRQWRDVCGIVKVQGQRLDRAYLREGAKTLGVVDLLLPLIEQTE